MKTVGRKGNLPILIIIMGEPTHWEMKLACIEIPVGMIRVSRVVIILTDSAGN